MPAPRLVKTSVGEVPCRVVGEGPAVLAVHGLLVDSRLWDGVAAELAESARLVLPDLPLGAHKTPVPDRTRLDPGRIATALVEILDAHEIDTAVLVGNDTGAGLAQVAAAAHPERFVGLVLTSGDAFKHFPPAILKPLQPLSHIPGLTRLLVAGFAKPRFLSQPGALNFLCRHPVDRALVASWMAPALTNKEILDDMTAFFRRVRPTYTMAAAEKLRNYPHPAVIAWSKGDRLFPRRDAERLVETIPRARLKWIEDSLAFSPLDQPAQVAQAIRGVLAEVAEDAVTR